MGPKNRPNALAITSVGPISNVLSLLVNLLLFLISRNFWFLFAMVMDLLLVSWNSKEFSIPTEKAGEEVEAPKDKEKLTV